LILDFEFDQHLESHKHVINIIMGCYNVAPTEVPITLVVCCSSTCSISAKALIYWPSAICGRHWVDGRGAASSPGHDLISVFFQA
jgi:hypothetical protein